MKIKIIIVLSLFSMLSFAEITTNEIAFATTNISITNSMIISFPKVSVFSLQNAVPILEFRDKSLLYEIVSAEEGVMEYSLKGQSNLYRLDNMDGGAYNFIEQYFSIIKEAKEKEEKRGKARDILASTSAALATTGITLLAGGITAGFLDDISDFPSKRSIIILGSSMTSLGTVLTIGIRLGGNAHNFKAKREIKNLVKEAKHKFGAHIIRLTTNP